MKYRLTFICPNPKAIAARDAAKGQHVTQGAIGSVSHYVTRVVCGDQDDVDRFIREHLADVKEVRVTPWE